MVLQRNKKGNKQKIMGSKVVLRIAFSYRKPIENNNNNPNILDQNFISYVKLTKLFFTISLLANFDQIKTRATFKAFSLLKLKPNFGEFSFFFNLLEKWNQRAENFRFGAKIYPEPKNSNHLNTGLVWYSNGRFVSVDQMVHFSNSGLKTGLKKACLRSKMSGIWNRTPILSGVQVFGIQMVTVLLFSNLSLFLPQNEE